MLPRHLDTLAGHLVLALARALPMVCLIPAFGGRALPLPLRTAVGFVLAALCLPMVAAQLPDGITAAFAPLVARETLVGLGMGFVCSCWFAAAAAAGAVSEARVAADGPGASTGARPFTAVLSVFAIVVFLEVGGLHHVALGLGRSYEAIPVSASAGAAAPPALLAAALIASAKLFEAALLICAPVVVAALLVDLALGLCARAVPRLASDTVIGPSRFLLGIAALLLGLGGMQAALRGSLPQFLRLMLAAVRMGP